MASRLPDRWLHMSGGLLWHLRALRYRRRLWQPFCSTVANWLAQWQPPSERLLLIGPSAGYSLNEGFLLRWREVIAIEPDPLARILLRLRFPGVAWRFDDPDVFAPGGNVFEERYPAHAVLFANVLGQITPRDDEAADAWLAALQVRLASHHWASYHDVISTTRMPDRDGEVPAGASSLEEVLATWWQGGELELSDHGCFGLGKPVCDRAAYCIWTMQPGAYHVVEWLAGAPSAGVGQGSAVASAKPACIPARFGN